MFTPHTVHRFLVLLASLGGAFSVSLNGADPLPSDEEGFEPPVLEQPVPLLIPQQILHVSSDWDSAIVRMRIGAEGEIEDWIPLDLPHYKLVEAFDRAFARTRFSPARENGEAIAVELTASIPIRDASGYRILSETLSEHIESRLARINPGRYRLVVSPPSQLDEPLEVIAEGTRYVAVDESGNALEGTVTVEFYVDPEGVPRMIRVAGDPDPVVGEAAVLTVSELRFAPPRRNHNPTVVRARMPVVLGGGTSD